jgi:hypothetical protein
MSREVSAASLSTGRRRAGRPRKATCRRESLDTDSRVFDRFGLVDAVAWTFLLNFFSQRGGRVIDRPQALSEARSAQKYFVVDRFRRFARPVKNPYFIERF